mgnify:CR=1 FL=1
MKVYEILSESDIDNIDEAPAGFIGQTARKLGAKALNKIGMKGTAANMATKANVGDEANRIRQELDQYMAGSGIKKGQLEVNDFLAFLANAGFDKKTSMNAIRKYHKKNKADPIQTTLVASIEESVISEAIPNQTIDKVIMDLVKLGFKKQAGGKQARSKYAITQPGAKKSTAKAGAKSVSDAEKQAIDLLKKAGYNVTR